MVTKNLSLELKEDKILAIALHPGWVQTEIGGPGANTSSEACVAGILKMAQGFEEKHNGLLYDFKGELIPW